MLNELVKCQVQFFCRIENMEVPQGKDMPCLRTAFSHLLSFSNKPFAKEGRANIFDVDPLRLVIIDSNNFEIKNNGRAKERRY